MTIIEALRILHNIAEILYDEDAEAKRVAGNLLAAYDTLVPPIELWPADMNHFAIDANGYAYWHVAEPTLELDCWYSGTEEPAGNYILEPGLDWRECHWPRPEVQS